MSSVDCWYLIDGIHKTKHKLALPNKPNPLLEISYVEVLPKDKVAAQIREKEKKHLQELLTLRAEIKNLKAQNLKLTEKLKAVGVEIKKEDI